MWLAGTADKILPPACQDDRAPFDRNHVRCRDEGERPHVHLERASVDSSAAKQVPQRRKVGLALARKHATQPKDQAQCGDHDARAHHEIQRTACILHAQLVQVCGHGEDDGNAQLGSYAWLSKHLSNRCKEPGHTAVLVWTWVCTSVDAEDHADDADRAPQGHVIVCHERGCDEHERGSEREHRLSDRERPECQCTHVEHVGNRDEHSVHAYDNPEARVNAWDALPKQDREEWQERGTGEDKRLYQRLELFHAFRAVIKVLCPFEKSSDEREEISHGYSPFRLLTANE